MGGSLAEPTERAERLNWKKVIEKRRYAAMSLAQTELFAARSLFKALSLTPALTTNSLCHRKKAIVAGVFLCPFRNAESANKSKIESAEEREREREC